MNRKQLKVEMDKLGIKVKSMQEIEAELQQQIDNVPVDVCQQILDLMHSGKSVGDVCKITKLETFIVAGVIVKNIGHLSYLKQKVVDDDIANHENRCSMYNR